MALAAYFWLSVVAPGCRIVVRLEPQIDDHGAIMFYRPALSIQIGKDGPECEANNAGMTRDEQRAFKADKDQLLAALHTRLMIQYGNHTWELCR